MICMDELNAHSIKTTASPQLLNLFIINARDEVKNYQVFFQQDFAKYVRCSLKYSFTIYLGQSSSIPTNSIMF